MSMDNRFKIGDKVKLVRGSSMLRNDVKENFGDHEYYTVTGRYDCWVRINDGPTGYKYSCFELHTPAIQLEEDLFIL